MGLSKYKIGDLVKIIDERDTYGIRDFFGININKEFVPTVANTDGIDEKKYKVVRKNRFVYSGMQTGRDECIRISMYTKDNPIIVSPAYTTFEVIATDKIIPLYFFMLFLSKEKDRLGWFYSDSSIRANLDWDVFCDIELNLPPLPIQQKYVDIYRALLANQRAYERGLEDLKLACDATIENLRRKMPCEEIAPYLIESDMRNALDLKVDSVRGLATSKEMIPTKADMNGVSLTNYKIVEPGQIAYVADTSRRGDKVSMGYNNTDETFLVSAISIVFSTVKDKLLPDYLMLFLTRSEFDRYARFHSWGSARETFNFSDMIDVKIPIPDISIQQDIVNIYNAYTKRKKINERLKAQIKDLCPVLIKGSLEEAAAGKEA
ncbi:MAG: restriction endonuclease subunit S [Akkermansia sp.]|nr:restriction endonuclease subunit S [Akkermansia sp.]